MSFTSFFWFLDFFIIWNVFFRLFWHQRICDTTLGFRDPLHTRFLWRAAAGRAAGIGYSSSWIVIFLFTFLFAFIVVVCTNKQLWLLPCHFIYKWPFHSDKSVSLLSDYNRGVCREQITLFWWNIFWTFVIKYILDICIQYIFDIFDKIYFGNFR